MSERRWTEHQQHCIDDRGGTLLVSAAAGSGKTSVLVERIVRKILDAEHPLSVDRLLVMTFTNAAAAEMKQRIARELTARLSLAPTDLHLQRQLLALPRASFGTVHSFCFNLIRENAHLLDISPQFSIAEEQQLLLLRKEAIDETLEECYAERRPAFLELVQLLSNGKNDNRLITAVETIYHFIQSHPYPEQWLSQMETVYEVKTSIRETVWGRLLLDELTDLLEGHKKLLSSAALLCQEDDVLSTKYLPAIQTDIAYLRDLLHDIRHSLPWDDCFSRAEAFHLTDVSAVRKGADEHLKNRVGALREAVRKRLKGSAKLFADSEEQCCADLQNTHRTIAALYDVVRRFSARFATKKREQNLLDFNDAEHLALQLLAKTDDAGNIRPTALAQELSEQYDEIMVDEYQDTNAAQDALFSAISRNQGNLFYVGDVKQSIYRFRQAMPELFIRRRTTYAPYGSGQYPATISLGNNFRSRREVTDSVNFIFRQLMTEETGGICYDQQEELVCSASYDPEDGHETECLILDTSAIKTDTDENEIDDDTLQARLIAERIRRLLAPSACENGTSRPVRYKDICILLRNKKGHADAYRKELERQGIPVQHESSGAFFDTAELRLMLSLLRCIDNPALDIPLSAIMLSPLFGFTADELARIRLLSPHTHLYAAVAFAKKNAADNALATHCREFLTTLDRYRCWAASMTVDALVRRLYSDTALPALVCVYPGADVRKGNLQLLHDLCRRFNRNGFRGLSAFIRYVDHLQEQGGDFTGAVSSSGKGDAVSIMSVHGSKGLEFPIVFLAGLNTEFNRKSLSDDLLLHPTYGAGIRYRDPRTLNRYDTLPRRALAVALRNDSRAEELRVLYVAMTRAREKLILVSAQKKPLERMEELAAALTDSTALPASLILTAPSMSDWVVAALLRHPSFAQLRRRIAREDLPTLPCETPWHIELYETMPPMTVPAPDTAVPAEADPALAAHIRDKMAYSYPRRALSQLPAKLAASEVAHRTISLDAARSRPSFMSGDGLTPAERGTAMHTFMQFSDYAAAADKLSAEIQRLTAAGFLTEKQADSLDLKRLSAFFESDLYRRISASPRCLREYHFTSRLSAASIDPSLPCDTDEFVVVQGIADCIFEENGRLIIVDYKTDRVQTLNELAQRYRPQLLLYREALEKALQMPVADCLLYSFSHSDIVSVY